MIDEDENTQFARRLAGAQAGDPRAFDELVTWLDRPLLGFLRARGAQDVEGTANEVLARVFGRISDFSGSPVQFRAWVFRIARNLVIDEHRRRARRPDLLATAPFDLPEPFDPATPADQVDHRQRVEAMLGQLTPDQREVLLLRVVAGLSVEETAEVVGRRPGAVRALQHRALAQLRRDLSRNP